MQFPPTVNFGKSEIWLNIHAAVTILCACLPTYKPLRDLLGKLVSTIRDTYGSSLRFLQSRPGRSRLGTSKNLTDGERSNYDPGNPEGKLYYPANIPYHYSMQDASSTRELVSFPPTYWGHQDAAEWHETNSGNGQLVMVPSG